MTFKKPHEILLLLLGGGGEDAANMKAGESDTLAYTKPMDYQVV